MTGVLLCRSPVPTAANDVIDGVYVPVFMYHSVLKHVDPNEKYIVSLDNLESDIKYLKENGYNTVLFTDLVNYTKNEAKLPPNLYRYRMEYVKDIRQRSNLVEEHRELLDAISSRDSIKAKSIIQAKQRLTML